MSRRESVKYNLKYVLSVLHELGVDEEDEAPRESRKSSIVDLQPVMATLRAIGEIKDNTSKESMPPAYDLEYILATLVALGEEDPEDDELNHTLSSALTDKQMTAKHEIENIVSSLKSIESSNHESGHQMSHAESKAADHPKPKVVVDFDLQFVLLSLEALGEDENETETFLQSLNPARKNTLVRCNLEYVLSSLDLLEGSSSRSDCDEYKCASPPPPLSNHFERAYDDQMSSTKTTSRIQSDDYSEVGYSCQSDSPHHRSRDCNDSRAENKDGGGEYHRSASTDEYLSNNRRK